MITSRQAPVYFRKGYIIISSNYKSMVPTLLGNNLQTEIVPLTILRICLYTPKFITLTSELNEILINPSYIEQVIN